MTVRGERKGENVVEHSTRSTLITSLIKPFGREGGKQGRGERLRENLASVGVHDCSRTESINTKGIQEGKSCKIKEGDILISLNRSRLQNALARRRKKGGGGEKILKGGGGGGGFCFCFFFFLNQQFSRGPQKKKKKKIPKYEKKRGGGREEEGARSAHYPSTYICSNPQPTFEGGSSRKGKKKKVSEKKKGGGENKTRSGTITPFFQLTYKQEKKKKKKGGKTKVRGGSRTPIHSNNQIPRTSILGKCGGRDEGKGGEKKR